MIGVIASQAERPWVAEFFELFKTPWEFWRAGAAYDAVLCTDPNRPLPTAKLVVLASSATGAADSGLALTSQPGAAGEIHEVFGLRLPIYGATRGFGNQVFAEVRRERGQVVRAGYDLFGEVRHLLTLGQPPANALIPTLDRHIELLRMWLLDAGIAFVEIPPQPAGHEFAVCLTHDVDHPGLRFHGLDHTTAGFLARATVGSVMRLLRGRLGPGGVLRNWLAALKFPLVKLGLAADFWRQLQDYRELERDLGSTFFIVPRKHYAGRDVARDTAGRRATPYGAADIADELRAIAAAGAELGVHGLDAWCDAAAGRSERATVAQAVGEGARCVGVRMHWLCFGEQSPAALEAAGFEYDSTVGYNECVGFRAGTLQVFRPAGAERLLELPLHVMDTALFYPAYLNLSDAAARERVDGLLAEAKRLGGLLTVNWHDRSLAPERQWGGFYRRLLDELRHERGWCPTAGDAVAWFRFRRQARFLCTEGRVRVESFFDRTDLPALRLRVHRPGGPGRDHGFRDLEFKGDFAPALN